MGRALEGEPGAQSGVVRVGAAWVSVELFTNIYTPADVYEGRRNNILDQLASVKASTMAQR
jgi:hypothetical protein